MPHAVLLRSHERANAPAPRGLLYTSPIILTKTPERRLCVKPKRTRKPAHIGFDLQSFDQNAAV